MSKVLILGAMALLLLGACNAVLPPAESNGRVEQEETAPSAEEGAKGLYALPCFGCHARERFEDQEVFPHDSHRAMGLHCSQCHLVEPHKAMTLRGETCRSCHNMGEITLARTAMPARFDHGLHAGMFSCSECHRDVFRMKAGADRMDMAAIYGGKYCGKCHNGTLASAPDTCTTCHPGG
jgi:c(7)-type cytochrome triheme protein